MSDFSGQLRLVVRTFSSVLHGDVYLMFMPQSLCHRLGLVPVLVRSCVQAEQRFACLDGRGCLVHCAVDIALSLPLICGSLLLQPHLLTMFWILVDRRRCQLVDRKRRRIWSCASWLLAYLSVRTFTNTTLGLRRVYVRLIGGVYLIRSNDC